MIRNYIKIALRNLRKYRQFSIINIFGLCFAIAVALCLFLYVNDELSYDRFHPQASQLYRVTMQTQFQEKEFNSAWTPAFIGSRMQADLSDIEDYATLYKHFKGYAINKGNEEIAINDVYYASPNFFSFFGFELKYGNPRTVLSDGNNIVLHERLANQLFQGESIIGNTIETSDGTKKIVGIIEDSDQNSHFTPMVVTSIIGRWGTKDLATAVNLDAAYYNYVKLSGDSPADVKQVNEAAYRYFREWFNADPSRKDSFGEESITLHLQNIRDIHLDSNLEFEMEANGSRATVIVFSIVAVLILIIASINYTNLASARYLERIKELGIRKVLGSMRRQLAVQYFTESLVITSISAVAGWLIVQFALPLFNDLSGKELSISQIFEAKIVLIFMLMILACSLLSSIYPALVISNIKPVNIFKFNGSGIGKDNRFRKTMLVIQVAASGILLIFTFVIYQQLRFMQKGDLGFDKEQVMVLEVKAREARSKLPTLKQELLKHAAVVDVSLTGQIPGSENLKTEPFGFEKIEGGFNELLTNYMFSGPDLVSTLGIPILKGQNFNPENSGANRGQEVLVNETLVDAMNWDDPIGRKVKLPIGEAKVVGVIKDFHLKSLHHNIEPLTIIYLDNWAEALLVKVNTNNLGRTINDIEKSYKEMLGSYAFDYSFLDDRFARQYEADQQNARLFVLFSLLTVIISGMGLLGLIGFTLTRRSKEISIRRVFGASYWQVVQLLFREYGRIIIIGLFIAIPVGNYFIKDWLINFSYRLELSWIHFALPITVLILLTVSIIGLRSYSTIKINPTDNLKDE